MSRLERLEQTVGRRRRRPGAVEGRAHRSQRPVGPPSVVAPGATWHRAARRRATSIAPQPAMAGTDSCRQRPPQRSAAPRPPTGGRLDDGQIAGAVRDARSALRCAAWPRPSTWAPTSARCPDGALVISFAGEPHRARAEEYRTEVEKALAAAAGPADPSRRWSSITSH